MEFWNLLMQILLLLVTAFLMGVLAERLKQSPIIGYLFAGILIGPWVFNTDAVFQLSELGVALLLFSIGLEFSFKRLKSLGAMAFGGGTLQVCGTLTIFTLGFFYFRPLGEALALGAMVALSSTAVVMRVLVDRAEIDSPRGRNALGILLLQDIAVVPLVIMVTMIGQGGSETSVYLAIAKTVFGAVGMVVLFYILFNFLVPLLLKSRTVHASRDLIILLTIVTAIGSAWLAHALGLSPALGAFIAGMMLAECEFAAQIRSDIGTIRTLFVTLFFTSIGMLANPQWMIFHLHWIAAGLAVMIIGKVLIIYGIARLFGNSRTQALATGITLAQIGEFSFVLATTARGFSLVDENTFNLIVSVTITSIFLSPYMVSHGGKMAQQFMRMMSTKGAQPVLPDDETAPETFEQILIIGFGPAGQNVAEGLLENGITPSVLEMRPAMARVAREKGLTVHMGDAGHDEVLQHAGLGRACLVVVTIPDSRSVQDIVKNIRRLSPGSTVIARSRYNIHTAEIEKAGAHLTVDEEVIVGKHLSNNVLDCLKGRGDINFSCACALAGLPDEFSQKAV
ncbi:MAG: sodium:proton exchanger [Desulfobacteraceae bacterium]|nr:cation:proton antiporter [Desulfobacteraceae bacterium]MBC2754773.1 sodium:proton exchanger [Desulfobacteraceae bacterium]